MNETRYYALVGERPSAATASRPDLWMTPDEAGAQHSANRLLEISGLRLGEFLRIFAVRTNVLTSAEKGRHEHVKAVDVARRLLANAAADERCAGILALGIQARRAFGLGFAPPLLLVPTAGTRVAWMPHPSGHCRWWNLPGNCDAVMAFLRGCAVACSHLDAPPMQTRR